MQTYKKNHLKRIVLLLSDTFTLASSLFIACLLVDYSLELVASKHVVAIILITLAQLAVFTKLGLYRAVLRYASVDFLVTVLKAVSVAVLVFFMGFYAMSVHLPLRFVFVNWLLNVSVIGGSRLAIRYYFEFIQRGHGRRTLIYGAGDLGMLALRQLKVNKDILYSPVAFIDDDHRKHGRFIQGVKILGAGQELENIIDQMSIEEVIVAISEIESEKLREIVKRCRQKNIPCRIIPGFSRLLKIESNVRNVELSDLMRRAPHDLDTELIKSYLSGKSVLITGAGGSIGSEVVRQCLKYEPKIIFAVDQSEYSLYALKEELDDQRVEYHLIDVVNNDSLEQLFKNNRPEIIFHAAAYKHVPLLEYNLAEAVRNNIGATKNLATMADKYGTKDFVLISTDKAVRPSSIMGATKRVCELFVQNFNRVSKTNFVAVRFGNVLGSSGSVIPKFLRQINDGGPVTVTHADVTRYFMLIDEAVQLVLQAASLGKGGEIFILNMGKPIKIAEMAEDLIYLMGRRPHLDIKIEYTGLRRGEKIYEELFNDEIEKLTRFRDITIGKTTALDWESLNQKIAALLTFAEGCHTSCIPAALKELVPDGSFGNSELNEPTAETPALDKKELFQELKYEGANV